jgi:hypothetical protein
VVKVLEFVIDRALTAALGIAAVIALNPIGTWWW